MKSKELVIRKWTTTSLDKVVQAGESMGSKVTDKVKSTMKEGYEAMKDTVGMSSPKKEPAFESSAVGMDQIEKHMRDTIPGTDAVGDSEAGAPLGVLESEKEAKEAEKEDVEDYLHRNRTEECIKGEESCSQ
jgi:hypothetical protein